MKKHYLEKVFATHFPNVKIPLKTNAESTFEKLFFGYPKKIFSGLPR